MTSTETLNFEKVWAMFQESDKKFQESREEFDRRAKETDRQMKETSRKMEETDRRIGELGNRFGELAEHLVAPSIMEKFNELGFEFSDHLHNWQIKDPDNPVGFTEIDILLGNGDIAIAIEVKAKPRRAAVDEHLRRMEVLRKVADRRNDKRKYQGALAGAIMEEPVRQYALEKGFYVIEQTGDTVMINIPDGFIPREWEPEMHQSTCTPSKQGKN